MNRQAASNLPTVDIIISTFNESGYIDRCLEHVLGQDYPAELMNVWLVDGGSTDETVAITSHWARRDPRLRVLASGKRLNLPEALNIALEHSSADVVAKIDAHGFPEKDYISRAVEALMSNEALKCVGGRPVQEGDTRFGEAVAYARGSRVGVGGSEYGGASERRHVETVQCGVYWREALDTVGWFDPAMNFGEDDELNWRLTECGYRILLDTRIRFHSVTRPTWRAAYRQYRNYGRARVMVVRKHPHYLRLYHLAPAAFLLTVGALAVAAVFSVQARYAIGVVGSAYFVVLALEAVRVVAPRLSFVPAVVTAFVALHLGYAVGMIKGVTGMILNRPGKRGVRQRAVEVSPR